MKLSPKKKVNIDIKDVAGYEKVKLVRISGNLDALNSESTTQVLDFLIEKNPGVSLIFDLREVGFIDSYGNLALIRAHIKAKKARGQVKIFGVNKNIKDIFELVGVTKLIPVYKFYEDALAGFKE